MQQDKPRSEPAIPCEPEWIELHHLFRYCAKSLSARDSNGEQAAQDGDVRDAGRCKRTTCVFSMKRG